MDSELKRLIEEQAADARSRHVRGPYVRRSRSGSTPRVLSVDPAILDQMEDRGIHWDNYQGECKDDV